MRKNRTDSIEYKHLKCGKLNIGIANPYIPHVRITNPHERMSVTAERGLQIRTNGCR